MRPLDDELRFVTNQDARRDPASYTCFLSIMNGLLVGCCLSLFFVIHRHPSRGMFHRMLAKDAMEAGWKSLGA